MIFPLVNRAPRLMDSSIRFRCALCSSSALFMRCRIALAISDRSVPIMISKHAKPMPNEIQMGGSAVDIRAGLRTHSAVIYPKIKPARKYAICNQCTPSIVFFICSTRLLRRGVHDIGRKLANHLTNAVIMGAVWG